MKIAKCPHCEEELVFVESYDVDIDDVNMVINRVAGHCPNCGREFQWEENYKYSHFSNLEEV